MKQKMISLLLAFSIVLGILPASALAAEDGTVPFSAICGEETLFVVRAEEDYTYSVTLYDEDWNPVGEKECSVPLYAVELPDGAEEVTLDFAKDECLAYGYDADGVYLAAYGDYGDGTTGQTIAVISGDFPAYVRVQTPYDADWNSDTLYAVALEASATGEESERPDTGVISAEQLMENIAAGYVESTGEWVILDMAAYEDLNPSTEYKTTAKTRQSYIDAAIGSICGDEVGESTYAKAILALQAVGADSQNLYPVGSDVPLSAVAGLSSLSEYDSSAWVAPYTLAALSQGDYGATELKQSIIDTMLANQTEEGCWSEWGDSIQTTANAIAGLAFYYGEEEVVTAAVDRGVDYLSSVQMEDGRFDAYGSGADANTAAMVVIALASIGINPATDTRFIKNETSAWDALLSFALADNSAFGYTDNVDADAYATEQGFRALIAGSRVMADGEAYNVYDFSANQVEPAYETRTEGGGGQGGGNAPVEEITVSFTLKTHQNTWIPAHDVSAEAGATVADVFHQVLDDREGFSYVEENGYISSITCDGVTWGEFDAGPNSGWEYRVNGTAPGVGMKDKEMEDGDSVVWSYITDYTENRDEDGKETTTPKVERVFSDVDGHWAQESIRYCVANQLMVGVSEDSFAPDSILSRGMLVTILYQAAGAPRVQEQQTFSDVARGSWYERAVCWAKEEGIVSGYGNGIFSPDDGVTREQLAVILMRCAEWMGYNVSARSDLSGYTDFDQVSLWAVEAVKWANTEGLMNGRSAVTLAPAGTATRGEAAAMLMYYLETVKI